MTSSHPVTYSRFLDREATSLARAGYVVSLIGLAERTYEAAIQGIRVIGVAAGTKSRKLATLRRIARSARSEQADVYQCLDPWTLAIGLSIKRGRAGAKVIYESSEWFPRMLLDRDDLPGIVRRASWFAVTRLERDACRSADEILETNHTRSQRFLKRGRQPVLVPNYPPLDLIPEPANERRPWIAYTGLISRHRGFEQLLAAIAQLTGRYPDMQLRVMGRFDPRDDIERRARNFTEQHNLARNVTFLGELPYREMFQELRNCLAGVILLQPQRGNDYTGQPNKLFEFMGAGLALVASDFPEMSPVIREVACGWLVDPTRPERIAAALGAALADPSTCVKKGLDGRAAVLGRYNWSSAEKSLLGVYARISS